MRVPILHLSAALLMAASMCPCRAAVMEQVSAISRIQGPEIRFCINANKREAIPLFRQLASEAGVKIKIVSHLPHPITLDLPSATLEEALEALCRNATLAFRKLEEGTWVVGYEGDLRPFSAGPQDETEVDITYRCEYISADSLSGVLAKAFSGLRVITGPYFLSPSLEGNTNQTTDDAKALGGTDQVFKTHDVLICGPANLVRRAMVLAMKFDRPRKLVRINTKLTELSGSLDSDLGLNWNWSALNLQESVNPNANPANSIKGFKIGSFSHSPAAISAALQAREHAGKAKTLANPSLTLLDGERSFILIGERRLYPKQTGFNSQGLPIFDVAEIRTGIYLQVSVQVGLENDLTLTVFPQVSTVKGMMEINNSSYPIIATREAQTTVRLRSGEMLAIGGLMQSEDSSNSNGIPLLSRIPLLGKLFGVRSKIQSNTELVLLVVPEILTEDFAEAQSNRIN